MQALTESASLIYAQLLAQCLRGAAPSGQGLSFTHKTIRGRRQWYLQVIVGKQQKQYFIGPDSPELLAMMEQEKQLWQTVSDEVAQREKLVAMALAGGALTVSADVARVLQLLERAGVFLAGGVLAGSHAFSIYGSMLGVIWDVGSLRTHDIDLAVNNDSHILLGISDKNIDLKQTLLESNMGFFAVPALDRKASSTSFSIRGKELSVDVLTPMHGKSSRKPVHIAFLNTYAEPIRFLDFLLEDAQPAVIVAKSGILVNVPAPGRYALHKLVISQRRMVAMHSKAAKDIIQATQLLEWLLNERPGEIALAFEAAARMPERFMQQLKQASKRLPEALRSTLQKYINHGE